MRSRASRSLPSHSIEPASGKKTPVIIRMVVVFPAPFRPSNPVIVPRWTVNETPSTARTSPNVFTTSRTDKTTDMRKLSERLVGVLYEREGERFRAWDMWGRPYQASEGVERHERSS